MQDLVGRTIGQYKIVEQIGRGGMASVYKGFQSSLNRFVAIKVLAPGMAMDPTFLERFRREATSVAGLQHPNILPVYDFNQDQQSSLFYIVMMMVSSGTLRDRIGTLPLPVSLRIASQLADALDFAHSRNVIHRDVNVFSSNAWKVDGNFIGAFQFNDVDRRQVFIARQRFANIGEGAKQVINRAVTNQAHGVFLWF